MGIFNYPKMIFGTLIAVGLIGVYINFCEIPKGVYKKEASSCYNREKNLKKQIITLEQKANDTQSELDMCLLREELFSGEKRDDKVKIIKDKNETFIVY